jgi:surface antigen
VESLAVKFGLTADSIRLSNGLTGSALEVGKTLVVPPVNGLVYKVKSGDTPDTLASKYRAEKSRIIAFNDAELGGLVEGDNIVIPDGLAPIVASKNSYVGGFAFGSAAVYGYNGYDYGWCTWWAAKRRADVGKPIPANFGDACNWVRAAQRASIPTGNVPSGAGDVIFTNSGCLGHVAFVEEMEEDGSIWVTDMNSHGQVSKTDTSPAGGWNRVSWRHVTPDQFGRFQFIY